MIPSNKNFCGGAFPDWLEVNLTDKCNGTCSWCIERNGYHPVKKVKWFEIAIAVLKHGAKNIILLGGEPTLYSNLKEMINVLEAAGRNVWITTNGSLLTPEFIEEKLLNIKGINISIHHYSLNESITGVKISKSVLISAIQQLHKNGSNVRMNCNCISGFIDNTHEITKYILFCKEIGADKIRFAELKQDDDGFVDLAKALNYKYGLNHNPFLYGCNSDTVIYGMPVNFRQMCGLQTTRREMPIGPQQCLKKVLYYDGNFYNGWQTEIKEEIVEDKKLIQLLKDLKEGKKDVAEVALIIGRETGKTKEIIKHETSSGGCQY